MSIEIEPSPVIRAARIIAPGFEDCDPHHLTPDVLGAICSLGSFGELLAGNTPTWEAAIAQQAESRFLNSLAKLGIITEEVADTAQFADKVAMIGAFAIRETNETYSLWRAPEADLGVAIYSAEKVEQESTEPFFNGLLNRFFPTVVV